MVALRPIPLRRPLSAQDFDFVGRHHVEPGSAQRLLPQVIDGLLLALVLAIGGAIGVVVFKGCLG